MVGVNVDVLVIESGEGDFVDALFDRGNPHHRWVADGVAATGGVVKIHCCGTSAFDVTILFGIALRKDV